MSSEMKFFEFNKYEYYALILASNEEYAKLGYKEEVADIEEEEDNFSPDALTEEEALEKWKRAIREEDKIKEFNEDIKEFKEAEEQGLKGYIVLLIDGNLL